jgi:hypothetical protein
MPQFFARVELRGYPTEADYNRLHAVMDRQGFKRVIKGSDGVTYNLPTGSYYNQISTYSRQSECNAIKKDVNSIWSKNMVMVVESAGINWDFN